MNFSRIALAIRLFRHIFFNILIVAKEKIKNLYDGMISGPQDIVGYVGQEALSLQFKLLSCILEIYFQSMRLLFTFKVRYFLCHQLTYWEGIMQLMFKDIGNTISIKTCYSRFLSSAAVLTLMLLLSTVLLLNNEGGLQETAQNEALMLVQK
ncbi:MAG: hypothetical protein ACJAYR_000027 [Sneathiella sp.]